ncbi:hypothetical protein UY3_07027 [Chelonia mydas]|uniref:Uncharacterized protein n=1 Tax=Chelonia mydas TaxID=8469 RepID=M7BJC7_CHEMY|nr:hypothetical protein UY3_07027 [Chelonia mydas]
MSCQKLKNQVLHLLRVFGGTEGPAAEVPPKARSAAGPNPPNLVSYPTANAEDANNTQPSLSFSSPIIQLEIAFREKQAPVALDEKKKKTIFRPQAKREQNLRVTNSRVMNLPVNHTPHLEPEVRNQAAETKKS